MMQLVLVFLETICMGLPVCWGVMLLASMCRSCHLVGVNALTFFAWTVLAAGAILFAGARRRAWSRVALAVVVIGTLRLLVAVSVYGVYGLLLCCAGLVLIVLERKREGRISERTMSRPSHARNQQSGDLPQAVQPEQCYEHIVERARYTFSDVVGMTETKRRLLAAAREILTLGDPQNGKVLERSQVSPRNGILLYGETGNGKTMLSEALSGELNIPFIRATYGDVASRWINETPAKIKAVFEMAKRTSSCVLFIDEFDSFAKSRTSGQTHSMDHDMTNVVLTEIVALRGTRVILIAASNFIDTVLDPAAIREGRFDFKIEMPPPDFEARKALLHRSICKALGQGSIEADMLANLAQRWEGFSASRLDALGAQLGEMRDNGLLDDRPVSYDTAVSAMRLLQGRKGKLPEDVKPIDDIIMPGQSRHTLRDLAFRMKHVYEIEKSGGRIPTGLVFSGPPGSGKTQAAMSLAKESGYAFLSTTGGQIATQSDSWDRLVREARDLRPVVVLIDEGEDALMQRLHSNVAPLTSRILATLDGANGRTRDILYICTTNHLDRIDPAALRGGRFEETIVFNVPDAQDMQQYASTQLRKLVGSTYVIMPGTRTHLQQRLIGRSIADANAVLQKVIDAAALRAVRERINEVRPTDVDQAAHSVFAARSSF